jgi:hypothetical protein
MKNRSVIIIVITVVILISLPYILGVIFQGEEVSFSGLILNPIDGYSYFAKMEEGYKGNWLFTLPFNADPGKPVFLFSFYLFLGNISRVVHIPIPWIYHIARITGFLFLIFQLWVLIKGNNKFKHISDVWMLLFLLFSSGIGWIALFFGHESGDLLIAEAYPFYSSLINPHFPWGIGLVLTIVNGFINKPGIKFFQLFLSSILLAIIMPFGSVIICLVVSMCWLIDNRIEKAERLIDVLTISLPAALLVGYQYIVTLSHPQLQIWNQQNVTPTPPVWDIALSFSPMIILALFSLINWKKNIQRPIYKLSLIWFILCLTMVLIPFAFQRRFLFAFSIPMTLLGLFGLDEILNNTNRINFVRKLAFILPVISILLLLIISVFTIFTKSHYSYYTNGEVDLFKWIRSSHVEGVILADPDIAIKIPANTSLDVYYGHPFETINAPEKIEQVEKWLSCQFDGSIENELKINGIDYILIGRYMTNDISCFTSLNVVYENSEFLFLKVGK